MKTPQRPPAPPPGESVTVQPGAYPVFAAAKAMKLTRALRDNDVAKVAVKALADTAETMKTSVLDYIEHMEAAERANNYTLVYQDSHEIRGLAGNAGLAAAARIANELCRYLDALSEIGKTPDRPVVRLHLGAISRAARATDDATRLGDTVARELAQLVSKKLAEVNGSETA
jgi:hypothetical protein